MRTHKLWWLAVATFALLAIAGPSGLGSVTPVVAQEPGGTITPPDSVYGGNPGEIPPPGTTDICGAGRPVSGNQIVSERNLRIALPSAGNYTLLFGVTDPGGEFVRVCYVEGDAAIFLNAHTGDEINRVLTSDSVQARNVLDQIAASVDAIEPVPATPTPEATPQSFICPTEGTLGGRTIPAVSGVEVVLPENDRLYLVFLDPPGSPNPTFTICAGLTAKVEISANTCEEISREVQHPDEDNAVLDQIVASCTLPSAATPVPTTEPPTSGTISPPDTGSGGLLP